MFPHVLSTQVVTVVLDILDLKERIYIFFCENKEQQKITDAFSLIVSINLTLVTHDENQSLIGICL